MDPMISVIGVLNSWVMFVKWISFPELILPLSGYKSPVVLSVQGQWKMQANNVLSLQIGTFKVQELFVHEGFDWENNHETLLFTGLDSNGYSIWGKKIIEK